MEPSSPSEPTITGDATVAIASSTFAVPATVVAAAPVLFAHGFGQTRAAWQRTAQAVADAGFPAISYDARGHGQSGRNPDALPYTGEQFTDDLIVLAGEMPQPPVLVGASMGGLFGLMAEARWPGLFRALVLVDVTPRWESAGLSRIVAFTSAFAEGFASLEAAADAIAAYLPQRRERKSSQALQELLRQDARSGRWHWHWDGRLLDELVRDSGRHQQALVEAARKVRCPVLLISGGRSDLVSPATIAEFQSLVPHAQHVQLADASHMLAGDDNDAFTQTLLDYLRSVSSRAHHHPTHAVEKIHTGARS
ncbi:alpha/beta fold hydrolase [Pseudoxanthomonas composti]|uniref:Alpha/beta hydrolase n=1 Tax=Pseudoxanthomonas composti TaxID=2137479 RepID=A0A4Q1K0X2_9GAMM|nr:alpha/beta hydrolase [Pseudoxanthomonas composti]RXR08701.1 alpha/beta hydrolase [Pseudoxanthomonas composti]